MEATHLPLLREMDSRALGFWGVVSGTFTHNEFRSMTASQGEAMSRSLVAQRLRHVLHDLASRSVISDATAQPPFDADRRCRSCGTVHAENGFGGCLRGMFGDGARRAEQRSAKAMRGRRR